MTLNKDFGCNVDQVDSFGGQFLKDVFMPTFNYYNATIIHFIC